MSATPRPPAVTMACLFVGLSSFLMLIELVGALTNWGTIEMQKALQPTVAQLNDRGLELTMGELLALLRWVGLGSVVVLVAGLVFAIYAVRGDRLSRIGATAVAVVLAVLIVPLGWLGLLQAVFLLTAAFILWSPDARQWYATKRVGEAEPEAAAEPHIDAWSAQALSEAAAPTAVTAPPTPAPAMSTRPRSVLAAGLVTVIGSTLVGGFAALFVLIYSLARDEYVRAVQEGPFADWFSAGELESALRFAFLACLAMLPLALAGLAAGVSLLAGLRVGRVATLALAWITAAAGVVFIPLGLLGTAAGVAVIVLLNRDESRAWTAGAH